VVDLILSGQSSTFRAEIRWLFATVRLGLVREAFPGNTALASPRGWPWRRSPYRPNASRRRTPADTRPGSEPDPMSLRPRRLPPSQSHRLVAGAVRSRNSGATCAVIPSNDSGTSTSSEPIQAPDRNSSVEIDRAARTGSPPGPPVPGRSALGGRPVGQSDDGSGLASLRTITTSPTDREEGPALVQSTSIVASPSV
jgi:hypothetical protein